VVEVTNQGLAIPQEQVDRISERFFRVDAAWRGTAWNAGPGLAIVKSTTDLHRGKIDVASSGDRLTLPPWEGSSCEF